MVSTRLVTAEDLWEMQDEPYRFDLIEGELFRMPGGRHAWTGTTRFAMYLGLFVERTRPGAVYSNDTGFNLERNPDTTLCPDVAFVREERLPSEEDEIRFLTFAPDLGVDIVSPSTRRFVLAQGREVLRERDTDGVDGVPSARTVEVHLPDSRLVVLGVGDVLDCGDLLPGLFGAGRGLVSRGGRDGRDEAVHGRRPAGMRYEPDKLDVIDGELFRMPGAGGTHGRVGSTVDARLHDFVEQRDLGVVYTLDTGFILERNPYTTLCPDIAFVKKGAGFRREKDELRFLNLRPISRSRSFHRTTRARSSCARSRSTSRTGPGWCGRCSSRRGRSRCTGRIRPSRSSAWEMCSPAANCCPASPSGSPNSSPHDRRGEVCQRRLPAGFSVMPT